MGWRPNPAAIDPNSPDYNPDPMANPGHTHTGDPGFGDLLAANNLSDVPNPVAALENLSGVSKQAARAQKGRGVPVNAGLGAWYDSGAIAAAIRRCYAEAGDPFMVNAGCEIPAATPPGNLRALCEPMAPA